MQIVPLQKTANQSLSFTKDGSFWELRLVQTDNYMAADIRRDGVVLVRGLRVVAGTLLLPYNRLWYPNHGNMVFDGTPDWELFGNEVNLYYLSNEEAREWQRLL